jgi:hypothetical protein
MLPLRRASQLSHVNWLSLVLPRGKTASSPEHLRWQFRELSREAAAQSQKGSLARSWAQRSAQRSFEVCNGIHPEWFLPADCGTIYSSRALPQAQAFRIAKLRLQRGFGYPLQLSNRHHAAGAQDLQGSAWQSVKIL